METENYIGIGGLIVAAISLITGFVLQKDNKKIRDLERKNRKPEFRLIHTLNALEGYEIIEKTLAEREGITLKDYRTKAREEFLVKEYRFVTPSEIKEYKIFEV